MVSTPHPAPPAASVWSIAPPPTPPVTAPTPALATSIGAMPPMVKLVDLTSFIGSNISFQPFISVSPISKFTAACSKNSAPSFIPIDLNIEDI